MRFFHVNAAAPIRSSVAVFSDSYTSVGMLQGGTLIVCCNITAATACRAARWKNLSPNRYCSLPLFQNSLQAQDCVSCRGVRLVCRLAQCVLVTGRLLVWFSCGPYVRVPLSNMLNAAQPACENMWVFTALGERRARLSQPPDAHVCKF